MADIEKHTAEPSLKKRLLQKKTAKIVIILFIFLFSGVSWWYLLQPLNTYEDISKDDRYAEMVNKEFKTKKAASKAAFFLLKKSIFNIYKSR